MRMIGTALVTIATLVSAGTASAQSSQNEVAASINLLTDRVWRGLSQTEGGPAIIAEAKFNHKDGPFAGLVITNFSSDRDAQSGLQLTPFFGVNRTIGQVNLDIGVLHREHLGAASKNFDELSLSAGYKFKSISVRPGIFYALDHYLPGNPTYIYVDSRAKLGQIGKIPLSLSAHAGTFNAPGPAEDYTNWRIGLSAPLNGVTFSANLSDADIDATKAHLEGSRYGGTRLVLSAFALF